MKDFIRALSSTIIAAVLILFLWLSFVLINEEVNSSGFSSGEVFALKIGEGEISGEVMGESFVLSGENFSEAAEKFSFALIFLPPPLRLVFRIFGGR